MTRPVHKSIILMGMKHSGKSTLGNLLADKLKMNFIDLDDLIEKSAQTAGLFTDGGVSCRRIYSHSPALFKEYEEKGARLAVKKMARRPLVLALGGGTIENEKAMALLKTEGRLLYLEEKEERLLARILKKDVPPFLDIRDPEGSFHALFLRRTRLYKEAAEIIVNLNGASVPGALELVLKNL